MSDLHAQVREQVKKTEMVAVIIVERQRFEIGMATQRLSALKSLVDCARKRSLCSFTLIDVKGLRSQKYRDTRGRTVDEYRSVLAEIDKT